MISSEPTTGSVSHPNGGSCFWVFLSFLWISAWCVGQAEIVVVTGVLNCNVALRGASEREKPASEKSFQERVALLAARSYEKG